jgi:hypothetical protein
LSVAVSFAPITPLIVTAPVVRPLLRRLRAREYEEVTGGFLRWAVTVFVTILVSAAFVRDRVLSSFPLAGQAAGTAQSAVEGSGGAPVGFLFLVLGMIAFVALSAASLGIAACVLASVALGTAAAAATVLFTHGNNVLLITLVAVPFWEWALWAAAVLAFAPATVMGGRRLHRLGGDDPDMAWLKRRALVVAGLFVLGLLCRLLLAGPYLSLIRHWTVF